MTAQSMKQAMEQAVAPKAPKTTEKLEQAAKDQKSKVVQIFSPMQILGQFESNLDKETVKKLNPLYGDLLEAFSSESQSRIEIGKTLLSIRELLGDTFGQFLKTCVVEALRKSIVTCYNYMALADIFTLKFAKNRVFASALARIWGAEGCFDTTNGTLKPAVDEAIGAIGGIPESTDSVTCEVTARKFVKAVDALVADKRKATPGGREKKWDGEQVKKKQAALLTAFTTFIKNDSVSSQRAQATVAALLIIAMKEMSGVHVRKAFDTATEQFAKGTRAAQEAQREVEETRASA